MERRRHLVNTGPNALVGRALQGAAPVIDGNSAAISSVLAHSDGNATGGLIGSFTTGPDPTNSSITRQYFFYTDASDANATGFAKLYRREVTPAY